MKRGKRESILTESVPRVGNPRTLPYRQVRSWGSGAKQVRALPSSSELYMAKTVGYMVTFTTYGSWLQGREQGFVKDGEIRGENVSLARSNVKNMKGAVVRLNKRRKAIVREAILEKARKVGQRIIAIAVQSNHVHMVIGYDGRPIEETIKRYKNVGTVALREDGHKGKVWTRGYDKRFCFDERALKDRIAYVMRHKG